MAERVFEPVSPTVSFPELDHELLSMWEANRIFEKTVEGREDREPFVFYEGPPTANGMPHPGHVLTRVMKDVFLRYRTMRGHYVPRRGGWDTHGLPVEVEVEKDLGIRGRQAIEDYGIEAFTKKCIESVFRYIEEWRRMTRRIGFWVDLDAAYVTFHKSYVESIWWALKRLFDEQLLYQDYKIVWWWPQGGTALSAGEVGLGYREIDDPSITVRFPLLGETNTAFLAWTTTPWTLPSNVALAVHPKQRYGFYRKEDGETLVTAVALASKLFKDAPHELVREVSGAELAGLEYEPPFRYKVPEGGPAYRVIVADFVTVDSGSGMVHVAPAFGEDDFKAAKENGLGFLQLVGPDGTFTEEVTDFRGRFCKEADRDIIRNLRQRRLLFSEEVFRHNYPFSWRRDTDPLIQYARRSWFIRTTREIDRVIENNSHVNWEPTHIKEGRFGEFLRSNVDWALSRERFWGTPLPLWVNDTTGAIEAVASAEEILAKNPEAFAHFYAARDKDPTLSEHLMVHKPWIDDVVWQNPGEPGVYRRVSEVIDCWFDSGCMPFAQWGYPHQRREEFERCFPADFITEALDQTRGWFYSLIAISSLLFRDTPYPHPFRNCVVLGLITDEKGQKLSKSKRNYTDPMEMMEEHGGDAVRWALYTGTVPGQSTRFFDGAAVDALRDFLLKLWNVYSFFVTYANIDGWSPSAPRPSLGERTDMDRFILAELDATVREVRGQLDGYRSHLAARRIEQFVDALSNWYVRRSRGRFWASGDGADKMSAFATLYEVLSETAHLIAPFTPFVAEALFQNLVRRHATIEAAESVHLAAFPEPVAARADDGLIESVDAARIVVALGQRVRTEAKLKVRQPLSEAIVVVADEADRNRLSKFEHAIREELNVHRVTFTGEPARYVDFKLVPNFRALGPKLGKQMPACKKVLAEADGGELFAAMERDGVIDVALPDGPVSLGPDEVEVRLTAKEHFAAASERGRVVVLDTRMTQDLRIEGVAREIVNRVQRARKALDLPYEARILVRYEAEGQIASAFEAHQEAIAGETLAANIERAAEPPRGEKHQTEIDGEKLTFWIERVL